jgi:hypothetical protein
MSVLRGAQAVLRSAAKVYERLVLKTAVQEMRTATIDPVSSCLGKYRSLL